MDLMSLKQISPDLVVFWKWKFVTLNLTIVATWVVMLLMTGASILITRKLSAGPRFSRWQSLLEVVVSGMREQIREVSRQDPGPYLPFVGTLFLFIAVSNLLAVIPGAAPPTGSLSTTAGLALCVFFAVPIYGIAQKGVRGYFRNYIQPTVFMLPFHVIGELSRTLSLAVRLFGNVMSGTKIVAILLAITPLFFPIVMQALGLLTGLIQAYIFAILAMVYIASATRAQKERGSPEGPAGETESAHEPAEGGYG